MAQVAAYHRPEDLRRALDLLAGPNRTALAGGTILNADREPPAVELVDLQALGLDRIESVGSDDRPRIRLGATAPLDAVASAPLVPAWLQDLARAELPSTLRTLATIGGTVAAGGGDSLLLGGLLASGAEVEVVSDADRPPASLALAAFLADGLAPGALITAVIVDAGVRVAVAATGRTPADVPIVAAVAGRAADDGGTTLALTGVAATPVLVDPADPTAGIDPPGDFRGSSTYRRHLAAVLSARALAGQS